MLSHFLYLGSDAKLPITVGKQDHISRGHDVM
jgi:hypothetical protein